MKLPRRQYESNAILKICYSVVWLMKYIRWINYIGLNCFYTTFRELDLLASLDEILSLERRFGGLVEMDPILETLCKKEFRQWIKYESNNEYSTPLVSFKPKVLFVFLFDSIYLFVSCTIALRWFRSIIKSKHQYF